MLATLQSCTLLGIDGLPVNVEVDIRSGLPNFTIVGLPDNAVRESRDRVKAAIDNCGYAFPNKKITVNLAPAEVKKEGSGFDLPIAIGILAAMELIPPEKLKGIAVVGELSLDGQVRGLSGMLPRIIAATQAGLSKIYIPQSTIEEAKLAANTIDIVAVHSLPEVVEDLLGINILCNIQSTKIEMDSPEYSCDFSEVRGQYQARRALEIAASGQHNVLLSGPPGSGKTMLARRMPTIMPPMSFEQVLETTKIYSVSGLSRPYIQEPPFRSPHHTISDAGLIGGGNIPRPGEVSLSHNGVLFLDELPEFKKQVLEVLRQPLEDGQVTISRAKIALTYPANFIFIASMNPCPCGHGPGSRGCNCNPAVVERYLSRISGPLLDRIDIHLTVPALEYSEMSEKVVGESSETIRKRVHAARSIQAQRFAGRDGGEKVLVNSNMGPKDVEQFCKLDAASAHILEKSVTKLGLSARAYHRILKISRTIADLDGSQDLQAKHVAESIGYRRSRVA